MLFNSYSFMLFFPIVVLVYFVVPKKMRYIWLLLASYFFYMGWNAQYAILIGISTVITYLSGRLIDKLRNSQKQYLSKYIVMGSFTINLGILAFFKYANFIWQNISGMLSVAGITMVDKPFDILLPVGISFYTFQALGYTMDVYRGDMKAEKNLLRYALFVSFFPQLVAGPIERSPRLLNQVNHVEEINVWNFDRIIGGLILMLYGLFLKMVIADRISIVVDTVYNNYYLYGSVELILATVCFAIQIYCDFGSYSLIAIGASKVMGFALMENFEAPYFSRSIKEFWRRWHISLSTWFRDYLYIPLGGSRCSKAKKYRNLLITFFVSGLWHGASWSFVTWGCLHGVYQVIGDLLRPPKNKLIAKFGIKEKAWSYKLGQMLVTFVLVDFAWIFFRMNSLRNSLNFIWRIITKWNPWVLFDQSLYALGLDYHEFHILVVALLVLLLADFVRYKKGKLLDVFLQKECLWFRWSVVVFLLFFILIFGIYGPTFDAKSFIYFQF